MLLEMSKMRLLIISIIIGALIIPSIIISHSNDNKNSQHCIMSVDVIEKELGFKSRHYLHYLLISN